MSGGADFGGNVQRIVDRREDLRYEGEIEGSFTLSSESRTIDGSVMVFACRISSISSKSMVLTAPAKGVVGEQIWIDVRGFGIVRGEIDRHIDEGFVLRVLGNAEVYRKLGAWVSLLRRRGGRISSDKREHMRAQPRDPRTMVRLPDGRLVRGLVSNISRSGAAISADGTVVEGDEVVVGLVPARVVRHLDVGFAVSFGKVLEAAEVDRLVTGFADAPVIDRDAV